MGHTPGPWKLIWHGTERYPFPLSVHTQNDESWIARDGTVSNEANARLIAAAPDLLEALNDAHAAIEALIHSEQNPHSDRIAQKASDTVLEARKSKRAALAKARGEQS